MITIHNNLNRHKKFLEELEEYKNIKIDLTQWEKFDNIIMSGEGFSILFSKTGEDFYEAHCDFEKSLRGKKSINISKESLSWMLKNRTSRIIVGIDDSRKDVRTFINELGMKKFSSGDGKQFYEIRSNK
jgi:hypothetical protein